MNSCFPFRLFSGTDEIVHKETVCDPLLTAPNAVVPISRKSFYATNFMPRVEGNNRYLDAALQRPTSNIVYRNADGVMRVVRENLQGANGLTLHPNNKQLYLVESTRFVYLTTLHVTTVGTDDAIACKSNAFTLSAVKWLF
jgi:sugar lactone lactonase YvrE